MNDRLLYLLEAYLEDRLTDAEAAELRAVLRASPEARRAFWEYVEQDALVEDVLAEARGRDLAALERGEPAAPAPPRGRSRARVAALLALAAGLLVAVGLWLGGAFRPGEPATPETAATVQAVTGDVQVIDPEGALVLVAPGAVLHTGQVVRVGDEEEGRVELLFPDGTRVTLSSGTSIRLLPSGAEGRRFHLERGAVQVQAAQGEDRPLVVTTDQARITAGSLPAASETRFRLYHDGGASRMELAEGQARLESPQGDRALDLSAGLYVVVTDEPEPMVPRPMPAARCRLRHTFLQAGDAVCFSPDGLRIGTRHFHRGWKVWGVADGDLRAAAPWGDERTSGLAFVGDTLVALGSSGTAGLWKVGEARASQTRLRDQELRSGAVSADGRWLAQGSGTGEVAVWEADPETGRVSLRRSLPIKPSRVALSSGDPLVAVSRMSGEIHVVEVKTGREVGQYKLRSMPTPLALAPDGRFLAAYANKDGLVLFDRAKDARRTLWPDHGARVTDLHFSADGRVLFAGLDDGTVRAWSTADGEVLLVLETGHRHVSRVVATADLALLATVGDNDRVKVWECQLP